MYAASGTAAPVGVSQMWITRCTCVWQGNVWNQIARVARDHDDKHTETRSLVTSSVETCDKQLRDDISQLLGSHEEKHREIRMLLPHQIELLESKLREETKGALKTFLDMHGRHQTTLYTCVSGWKPAEDLHRHHVKPRPVAGGGLPLWRPRPHGDREAALARCCDVLELHCGRERGGTY